MEKQNRLIVIYTIFIGISMVGLWGMLLITGQVPELSTTPFTAVTHISAELTTGSSINFNWSGINSEQEMGKSHAAIFTGHAALCSCSGNWLLY